MACATVNAFGSHVVTGVVPSSYVPPAAPVLYITHEQFIHAVRDVILGAHPNPVTRERLSAVKLVYGTGHGMGARGVTFFGTWKNGQPDPLDTLEVCAFGEESPIQLAGTTTHELAHALAGPLAGHGPDWKAACADLGLHRAEAAGQSYAWDDFNPAVREALQALPEPTDGTPVLSTVTMRGLATPRTPRPCPLGIGTRGGTSRGPGSGSRLRLWTCTCGVKVRVASDDFRATCNRCSTPFKR